MKLKKLTSKSGMVLNSHINSCNCSVKSYQNLNVELTPCRAYKAKNIDHEFDFIFMRHVGFWLEIIIIKDYVKPPEEYLEDAWQDGEWVRILENWTIDVTPIQIDTKVLKSLTQAYKLSNYD